MAVDRERLKAHATAEVEARRQELIDLSLRIHDNPETGLQEDKASTWLCEYLGHGDVHVLDGGFLAWNRAGYPVTTACPIPKRARFLTDPVPGRHIGVGPLQDSLGREDFALLDVRGDDEYYGRIARAARGGAIPGAVHIEYLQNMDRAGTMKPADELRTMYERVGVTPEQTVACY